MTETTTATYVDEAVVVFQDAGQMEKAADSLLLNGFTRASLSLLASEETVEQKLGHRYEKVGEVTDDPAAPRETFVDVDSRTEG